MMERRQMQRFGWDGLSFDVPGGWELALHQARKRVSRIELEDETALRLQMEWTRPGSPPDLSRIRSRYLRAAKALSDQSDEDFVVDGLPDGWMGFGYCMPDAPLLIVAYYAEPAGKLFCMFRLFFPADGRKRAARTLQDLAGSFVYSERGPVLWAFYDVCFTLDAGFRLMTTAMQAGRKTMVFNRGLRRFLIWHVSLADMALRDRTPATWAAEFLNRSKLVRGPVFEADGRDGVRVRRSWWHPLGHMDELGRLCFRYRAGCQHRETANQLVVWVYQFRWPGDLAAWEQSFRLNPLA